MPGHVRDPGPAGSLRYTHRMQRTLRYTYNDPVSQALAEADPQLGQLIDRIGEVEAPVKGSGFEVMAESIVWQQLSAKAGATIWRRLCERFGSSPESFASASHASLRAAGLSARKADHIADIARATLSGEIDWEGLEALGDEDVVRALVKLRGVGRWTAEMYLIFALGRPDVLASDDFGIRSSAGRLAGLTRPMTREELAARAELWRPHRTAASLWLWADQQ